MILIVQILFNRRLICYIKFTAWKWLEMRSCGCRLNLSTYIQGHLGVD